MAMTPTPINDDTKKGSEEPKLALAGDYNMIPPNDDPKIILGAASAFNPTFEIKESAQSNNDLRDALLEIIVLITRDHDTNTLEEVMDKYVDKILALFAQSNQRLLDKLLAELPVYYTQPVTRNYDAGFNNALDQCRKIVEGYQLR